MMSVDSDLYEAASLDGANKWHQFRYIILPSIKSIVVLNLILSISGSLSAFEPPYVITNGTMGTGTYFVIMNRIAHENQKVGLACAMAIVLLAIIIICTVAQKLFFKYAFDDGTSDESKAAVRKRKRAEKAARKAAQRAERRTSIIESQNRIHSYLHCLSMSCLSQQRLSPYSGCCLYIHCV